MKKIDGSMFGGFVFPRLKSGRLGGRKAGAPKTTKRASSQTCGMKALPSLLLYFIELHNT